jgi:hypothetical protein
MLKERSQGSFGWNHKPFERKREVISRMKPADEKMFQF